MAQYLAMGYGLTPVRPRGKNPIFDDWTNRQLSPDEVYRLFTEQPYNIGVRLGEPSGNLVDIDLDCPEVLAIADTFLPPTPAVFGRASRPRSHRLYRAPLTTDKFEDPGAKEAGKPAMLVELRSTRLQTVLPGSTHESGEAIEWDNLTGTAMPRAVGVGADELRHAVALLATAALLGRHYPAQGLRHAFELGLAGGLLRAGATPDEATAVLDAIAIVAGVGPDGTAAGKVLDTKKKIDAGDPVTGWPTVIDSIGGNDAAKAVVNRVIKWLVRGNKAVRLNKDDFYAFLPTHKYIFRPTGEMWDLAGVNGNLGTVTDGFDADGKPTSWKPSSWLDTHSPVHQVTWLPGQPELVENVLIDEGGQVHRPGMRAYNQYRAPQPMPGDPAKARPWIDLIDRLYPEERDHLLAWFAHRVQRPGEKINHALVLGGEAGIGKDTILEAVVHAVGPANCGEAAPATIVERFNEFLQSVILRVSEARDLGEANRYAFYERTKTIIAAPPETLRVDRKYVGAYRIPNLVGVIFTTNNRTTGLYLPADDRRHFVVWSDARREDFETDFFTGIYEWYEAGGFGHVRAHLEAYDLSTFDPKAPPAKTDAFWAMVRANAAPEEGALGDVLDALGSAGPDGQITRPGAITVGMVVTQARALTTARSDGIHAGDDVDEFWELSQIFVDRRHRSRLPHMLEALKYVEVLNPYAKDGRWSINGKRQNVYALSTLPTRDRIRAAKTLMEGGQKI